VDVAFVHADQAGFFQLVQHAREVLGRQAQARRQRGLAHGQRNHRLAADAVVHRLVAQQVAHHPLHAAAQGIGFHVLHQAVQAARDAGQHAQGKARVALDLGQHRPLADGQQQRPR
jgi:hypothetical protein